MLDSVRGCAVPEIYPPVPRKYPSSTVDYRRPIPHSSTLVTYSALE